MESIVEEQDLAVRDSGKTIIRQTSLAGQIVVVGGLGGCGKSLFTPVFSTFERVEIQKYNYNLEHVCSLSLLDKIDASTAIAMIRLLTDLDLYNLMISRDTNLRRKDCSSIWQNPHSWRYLHRLFQADDGQTIVKRIRETKPILQVLVHHALMLSAPLLAALGGRVRIIEIIRHPLYMVKQLYPEVERTDPRAFTVFFEHKGQAVPFFAKGWEDTYVQSNGMDKAIHYIERCSQWNPGYMRGLSDGERKQVLLIPFERFVLDPWPILRQLETFLNTGMTQATRRELRRQKVPRRLIADGMDRPVYRRCKWEPPQRGTDERRELDRRRAYAKELATDAGMELLDRMSRDYEATYLEGLL